MSNMLLKTIIGMSSEAGGSGGITTTPHNLTSNESDPRYIISQSSTIDIREAWMAMDGKIAPEGEAESHTNQGYNEWWQITFNEGAVKVISFTFTNRDGGNGYVNNPYYLQGSNDEFEWFDVLQFDLGSGAEERYTFEVNCNEKYQHWRILSPSYTYLIIGEIEFTYESNSGGSSGGNIIEADENCYVIDIQIIDPNEVVTIEDRFSNWVDEPPIIDWGDGTVSENDWNEVYEHYYNETGAYRIIWKNANYQDGGNLICCNGSNYITNVEQLSYNRTSWADIFYGCNFDPNNEVTVNLRSVPDYLYSMWGMFQNTRGYQIFLNCDSNNTCFDFRKAIWVFNL